MIPWLRLRFQWVLDELNWESPTQLRKGFEMVIKSQTFEWGWGSNSMVLSEEAWSSRPAQWPITDDGSSGQVLVQTSCPEHLFWTRLWAHYLPTLTVIPSGQSKSRFWEKILCAWNQHQESWRRVTSWNCIEMQNALYFGANVIRYSIESGEYERLKKKK